MIELKREKGDNNGKEGKRETKVEKERKERGKGSFP